MTDVLFLPDVAALRSWLDGRGDDVWLGFHRVRYGADPGQALTFREAADELAAIGWVDTERRRAGDTTYAVRFAPGTVERHPEAPVWADAPTGMPVLSPEYEARFRTDEAAWAFFAKQPPRYRRVAIWWVMSGKAEETRERRITALIEGSAAGRQLPALQRQL